jgi:peptide/nickel transport system permease protein
MLSFIIRRLALALFTIWAISVLAFVIIQLPPVDFIDTYITSRMSMGGAQMTPEQIQGLRAQYGADQPKPVQYLRWISLVARGDFGFTLEYQRPVTEVIGDRLALTMVVSLAALVVTWVVALPIGIYSAMHQYSPGDYVFTLLGFLGLAIPGFLLGLLVLYFGFALFNVNLTGLFSPEFADAPWSMEKFLDMLRHLPVPALILGTAGMAQAMRIMRANLLDEIRKPYVVTARAKGLSETRAILRYPVRVALNPFASTIGYTLPYIVSGSIIVSLVLGLPTVGPLLLKALVATDLFLAGAIVLLLGVMTVIGTFLSDLLLMWIDPRIRAGGRR